MNKHRINGFNSSSSSIFSVLERACTVHFIVDFSFDLFKDRWAVLDGSAMTETTHGQGEASFSSKSHGRAPKISLIYELGGLPNISDIKLIRTELLKINNQSDGTNPNRL